MVWKYFLKKIFNIFGLNIANLSSFYDSLLCLGPLPGTLLFWLRARASPDSPKKVKQGLSRAEPQVWPITITILGHQKLCSTDWPGATIKYLTAFFCLDSTIDRKKIENNIFLLNVARFSETLYDKTWVVFPLVMTTNLYLDRGDIVYYLKVEHS